MRNIADFGIFFVVLFICHSFAGKLKLAALVVEQVDTQDLKSCSPKREYGFDSRLGHKDPVAQLDRATAF